MPKCPDCFTEMEKVTNYYGSNQAIHEVETTYYKCPKCKIEVEVQDDN